MSCPGCREAHDGRPREPHTCTDDPALTVAKKIVSDFKARGVERSVVSTESATTNAICIHERVRRCADGKWRCFECSAPFELEAVAYERGHADGQAGLRNDYERACQTIAQMHEAAIGERGSGPIRGLVEDVADVRKERDELRRKVEDAFNRGHRAARLAIDRALKNPGRESLANLEYCIERLKEDSELSKKLCALLSPLAGGSTDDGESAVEVLERLIAERQSERDAAHRRDRLLENCVQALGITDVTHDELPATIADWAKYQRERITAARAEGRADVAVRLRRVVDPDDKNHWNLDGTLAEVARLAKLEWTEKQGGVFRRSFTLRQLQAQLPWTIHYHRDFRASPMAHKDFGHALTHVMKAVGKLASVINDAEHGGSEFKPDEVDPYVADLVICALRIATTCPGRQLDLEQLVVDRIEKKNSIELKEPAR